MTIPQSIVDEDNRLETAAQRATGELAKHRWHHTINEANPNRFTFTEYGIAVARNESTIRRDANAYAAYLADHETAAGGRSFEEHKERQKAGALQASAAEAVAAASGKDVTNVLKHGKDDVRQVREIATERAIRNETTIEEELPKAAEAVVRSNKTDDRIKKDRKERRSLRLLETEGLLAGAMQKLRKALVVSEELGELSTEEAELIRDTIGKVRAVLNLIDMRLTGDVDVDWDAELAKLDAAAKG